METRLSHAEAQGLFGALVDDELAARDASLLRSHLSECQTCHQGWVRYEEVVQRVRNLPRERAPMSLATSILRRERRRSFARRMSGLTLANRLPVELILPLLIAAAAAALLFLFWR